MNPTLFDLAQQVGEGLKQKNLMLVTAESCTGGQVAEIITTVAGSSNWFERGFVTYSNIAKQEMLGIPAKIINSEGAVSEHTVCAMAEGALKYSHANISLAITGIAGPEGGTLEKPVGTVWFAWAGHHFSTNAKQYVLAGDRINIRTQAVMVALTELIKIVKNISF